MYPYDLSREGTNFDTGHSRAFKNLSLHAILLEHFIWNITNYMLDFFGLLSVESVQKLLTILQAFS